MIVRSMLEDPDLPIDFFNDYKDTIHWLTGIMITGDPSQAAKAKKAFENLAYRYQEWHAESTESYECEWCHKAKPDVRPRLDPLDLADHTERMLCDECNGYQYE